MEGEHIMSLSIQSVAKNISIGLGLHIIVFLAIGYIFIPPWQTNSEYYYIYGLIVFVLPTFILLTLTVIILNKKCYSDRLIRHISMGIGIIPLPLWILLVTLLKSL
jgi:hypothetical protein